MCSRQYDGEPLKTLNLLPKITFPDGLLTRGTPRRKRSGQGFLVELPPSHEATRLRLFGRLTAPPRSLSTIPSPGRPRSFLTKASELGALNHHVSEAPPPVPAEQAAPALNPLVVQAPVVATLPELVQ